MSTGSREPFSVRLADSSPGVNLCGLDGLEDAKRWVVS
jgi:hypothetical protein